MESGGGRSPEPASTPRAVAADLRYRLQISRPDLAGRFIVGQLARAMENRQAAVCPASYRDLGLDVVTAVAVSRYLQFHPFETDTVVIAYRALITLTQDVFQRAANPADKVAALFPGRPR